MMETSFLLVYPPPFLFHAPAMKWIRALFLTIHQQPQSIPIPRVISCYQFQLQYSNFLPRTANWTILTYCRITKVALISDEPSTVMLWLIMIMISVEPEWSSTSSRLSRLVPEWAIHSKNHLETTGNRF